MLGSHIHYFRVKKGLTQEQLAEAICSVSYLSKIENNYTIPSEEIYVLLLQKLGVSFEASLEQSKQFRKKLTTWKEAMADRKLSSNDLYHELRKDVKKVFEFELILLFHILEIRYFLQAKDLKKAESVKRKIIHYLDESSSEIKGDFLYVIGLLSYYHGNIQEAIVYYYKAQSYFSQPIDQAELDYRLGLVYTQLSKVMKANLHLEKALHMFSRDYYFERCIDCHIVLGVNFRKARKYEEARSHFKKTLKLFRHQEEPARLAMICHNLGYVSYEEENYEEAVSSFEKSIELNIENNIYKLQSYYLLSRTFMKMNDNRANGSVEKALELLNQFNDPKLKEYELHLEVILHQLQGREAWEFIDLLSKKVIPFFLEIQHFEFSTEYIKLLANTYFGERKYKKASEQFKRLIDLNEKEG